MGKQNNIDVVRDIITSVLCKLDREPATPAMIEQQCKTLRLALEECENANVAFEQLRELAEIDYDATPDEQDERWPQAYEGPGLLTEFAMAALVSLVKDDTLRPRGAAAVAYEYAEAMMKEHKKRQGCSDE